MKKTALLIVLAVLLFGGYAWFSTRPFDFANFKSGEGPCPGKRVKFRIQDPQMSEYVADGTEVNVVTNYYACNPPKTGDIVLYRFSAEHRPVVRRIVAIPGDEFAVVVNAKQKAWNIQVNGEWIEWNGGPYFFGAPAAQPPIKLSEAQMKGVLAKDNVIILSGHPPGLFDSGMFGAVNVSDLIGKVDLPETQK